jgi:type VI protein secretion system component VasF
MPEGDVWRRKMDTVQQLSAMTRRVSLSNFEDDISKLRTQAMNELNDFVQLSRQGRFSNEAINSAMLTLDHIRAKFDEAGNLARIVQNLAAFA